MPVVPTENLGLDRLDENSNGVVRHNEAINALDAVVQLTVLDRDLTSPPGGPSNGDGYLVAEADIANWTDESLEAADWYAVFYYDGWIARPARVGWRMFVVDEDTLLVLDGTGWNPVGGASKARIMLMANSNISPAASLAIRNGHYVLNLATSASAMFSSIMSPDYNGSSSLVVDIFYALESATTGVVQWSAQFERVDLNSLDIDSDSFASAQSSAEETVPGTSGHVEKVSITFTNAQADGLQASEYFRLKISRSAPGIGSDASGNAQLLGIVIRQA